MLLFHGQLDMLISHLAGWFEKVSRGWYSIYWWTAVPVWGASYYFISRKHERWWIHGTDPKEKGDPQGDKEFTKVTTQEPWEKAIIYCPNFAVYSLLHLFWNCGRENPLQCPVYLRRHAITVSRFPWLPHTPVINHHFDTRCQPMYQYYWNIHIELP